MTATAAAATAAAAVAAGAYQKHSDSLSWRHQATLTFALSFKVARAWSVFSEREIPVDSRRVRSSGSVWSRYAYHGWTIL